MPEVAENILDETEETTPVEVEGVDTIAVEHRGLLAKLDSLIKEHEFWEMVTTNPFMKDWLESLRDQLNQPVIPTVETINAKDFAAWRDGLMAKKYFLDEFERKGTGSFDAISACRHEITTFENNNSMFMGKPNAEPEIFESDEAAEAIEEAPAETGACYLKSIDKKGLAKLSVSEIEKGEWATFSQIGTGAASRFTSKDLPIRDTREEAQADLDAYAVKLSLPNADEE